MPAANFCRSLPAGSACRQHARPWTTSDLEHAASLASKQTEQIASREDDTFVKVIHCDTLFCIGTVERDFQLTEIKELLQLFAYAKRLYERTEERTSIQIFHYGYCARATVLCYTVLKLRYGIAGICKEHDLYISAMTLRRSCDLQIYTRIRFVFRNSVSVKCR